MTDKPIPKGGNAVMSSRIEPPDSLDFFPTPPWATRALCRHVLPRLVGSVDALNNQNVWEPAAGEGHISEVLKEHFKNVQSSDVHDYGRGYGVGSFVGDGADRSRWLRIGSETKPDWVITNPPFKLAQDFAARAIDEAKLGVALLLRSVFIESEARYRFFEQRPLAMVAQFAERVPMTKGRWDPKASTATSYAWFIWSKAPNPYATTRLFLIPPGCKRSNSLSKAA